MGGLRLCETRSVISRQAPAGWIAPLLAHETFHITNGHAGHQSATIEHQIDFLVAKKFINQADYCFWESELDGNPARMASALEIPKNLVEAFQRHHSSRIAPGRTMAQDMR